MLPREMKIKRTLKFSIYWKMYRRKLKRLCGGEQLRRMLFNQGGQGELPGRGDIWIELLRIREWWLFKYFYSQYYSDLEPLVFLRESIFPSCMNGKSCYSVSLITSKDQILLVICQWKSSEDNHRQRANRTFPLLHKNLKFWLILQFCFPGNLIRVICQLFLGNVINDKMTLHRKITFRLGEVQLPDGKSQPWALWSGANTLVMEHGLVWTLRILYAATMTDICYCGARITHTPAPCSCLKLVLPPQDRCSDNHDNCPMDTAWISTGEKYLLLASWEVWILNLLSRLWLMVALVSERLLEPKKISISLSRAILSRSGTFRTL